MPSGYGADQMKLRRQERRRLLLKLDTDIVSREGHTTPIFCCLYHRRVCIGEFILLTIERLAVISRKISLMYFLFLLVKDRKSTRLNSSHVRISYAVFC